MRYQSQYCEYGHKMDNASAEDLYECWLYKYNDHEEIWMMTGGWLTTAQLSKLYVPVIQTDDTAFFRPFLQIDATNVVYCVLIHSSLHNGQYAEID